MDIHPLEIASSIAAIISAIVAVGAWLSPPKSAPEGAGSMKVAGIIAIIAVVVWLSSPKSAPDGAGPKKAVLAPREQSTATAEKKASEDREALDKLTHLATQPVTTEPPEQSAATSEKKASEEREALDKRSHLAAQPVTTEPPQHHPYVTDLVQVQSEFDQALRKIAASSAWRCPPTLASIIKGQPVLVYFSHSRLQEAAKAVYRLQVAGAIVTPHPVAAEGDGPKRNEILYHWSRLQAAQSIQEILQDIEPIEIKSDDQAGSPQLWIS